MEQRPRPSALPTMHRGVIADYAMKKTDLLRHRTHRIVVSVCVSVYSKTRYSLEPHSSDSETGGHTGPYDWFLVPVDSGSLLAVWGPVSQFWWLPRLPGGWPCRVYISPVSTPRSLLVDRNVFPTSEIILHPQGPRGAAGPLLLRWKCGNVLAKLVCPMRLKPWRPV